ncbi:MAG: TauD/TfdA family dioxygenase [Alphaproteobacteria bacterium]|nr:TauD/TfdA family dioxygenase [Alphaproteobacteria bacterium]
MKKYILNEAENNAISNITENILKKYTSAEDEEFLIKAGFLAHDLPYGLRAFLHDFKQYEDIHPSCIISGFKIDDERIGKSPKHWKEKNTYFSTRKEDIYFVLCASLVGHPIAWSTQQGGHVVHEIFPIKEHETDQLGFSSKEYLEWHIEDAFHPLRGDYIALMCIRNPTHTPTLIASNTEIDLTLEEYKPLFKPIFKIKPDNSHLQENHEVHEGALTKAQKAMQKLNLQPNKIPVLFGDSKSPYWRLDPYFMEVPEDEEARNALNSLIKVINENLKKIVINAGEIFFCDNYRVVHGRSPFTANYDGWDRWLKRLNIVNDLRKSRAVRASGTSRIFY